MKYLLLLLLAAGPRKAAVHLHFNKMFHGDTAFVSVDCYKAVSGVAPAPGHYQAIIDGQGKADFELVLPDKYAYLTVSFTHTAFPFPVRNSFERLDDYLIREGDDIRIDVRYNDAVFHLGSPTKADTAFIAPAPYHVRDIVSFSGVGSERFNVYDDYRDRAHRKLNIKTEKDNIELFTEDAVYNKDYSRFHNQMILVDSILNRYRTTVDTQALHIIRADLIGAVSVETYKALRYKLLPNPESEQIFLRNRPALLENIWEAAKGLSMGAMLFSKEYTDGLSALEMINFSFSGDTNYVDFYDLLKKQYAGEIRDKLLSAFFHRYGEQLSNKDSLINDAMICMETPYYRDHLHAFQARSKGAMAYNFTLRGLDDRQVSLADLKGKVVFIDFYYTGCPHCIDLYKDEIQPAEVYFKDNKDLVFVAISADDNLQYWKGTVHGGLYTAPDGGNVLNLNTAGFDHSLLKYYDITGYPCMMIIGRKGDVIGFDGEEWRKPGVLKEVLGKVVGELRLR